MKQTTSLDRDACVLPKFNLNLNAYLAQEQAKKLAARNLRPLEAWYPPIIPAITCVDGFEISVQASATHYCSPRNNQGPWTEVECGYPNGPVPSLEPYRDGEDSPVFGWTPVVLVEELIDSHGGLKP